MPVISAINKREKARFDKYEDPKAEYARVVIKLDDVDMIGTDIEIGIQGSYLAKISSDGADVYFRFDRRHNSKIYVDEFKEAHKDFKKIYLTNPVSQTGRTLVLQIGESDISEITPDTEEDIGYMSSSVSAVTGDGIGNNFGTPGVGKRFEILGYTIIETEEASMAITTPAKLKFETSSRQLWSGIGGPEGAVKNYRSEMMGMKSLGGVNEALTLTNADVSAGSSRVTAIIFYKVIGG